MNIIKATKISSCLFIIGIALACFSLYYYDLYKKISNEIEILKKEIIAKEFPKEKIKILYEQLVKNEINRRTNNFSQIEKNIEIGRQRVRSVISQNCYNASNEDIQLAKFKLSLLINEKVENILRDKINQRTTYRSNSQNLALFSAIALLTSMLLFLFLITLHMKRRAEKTNIEQRIGFLLLRVLIN